MFGGAAGCFPLVPAPWRSSEQPESRVQAVGASPLGVSQQRGRAGRGMLRRPVPGCSWRGQEDEVGRSWLGSAGRDTSWSLGQLGLLLGTSYPRGWFACWLRRELEGRV